MSDYYADDLPLFNEAVPSTAPEPELMNECKERILERLKVGPATCRQIDRLTPARGQALVHTMREDGYKIRTQVIEGDRSYVYYGFSETIRVSKTMQEAYYRTPHWTETAKERKDIDSWRCRQCNTLSNPGNRLETHHWVYELFAEDVELELMTLCKSCHDSIHLWIKGGLCHFPRKVEEASALQLGWEPKL